MSDGMSHASSLVTMVYLIEAINHHKKVNFFTLVKTMLTMLLLVPPKDPHSLPNRSHIDEILLTVWHVHADSEGASSMMSW